MQKCPVLLLLRLLSGWQKDVCCLLSALLRASGCYRQQAVAQLAGDRGFSSHMLIKQQTQRGAPQAQ